MNPKTFSSHPEPYFMRLLDAILLLLSQTDKARHEEEECARLLFQKFFLHSSSLYELAKKTGFHSKILQKRIKFYDPMSIWALLRSQFEAYLAFNHIFVNPKTKEEQHVRFQAWVLAGLVSQARVQNQEDWQQNPIITQALEKLTGYSLYRRQPKAVKAKIENGVDWKFCFDEKKRLNWQQMFLRTGFKRETFDQMYNLLSFFSHPTYISILQLKDTTQEKNHKMAIKTAFKTGTILIAFMLNDFIFYFNGQEKQSLPREYLKIIEYFNQAFRKSIT